MAIEKQTTMEVSNQNPPEANSHEFALITFIQKMDSEMVELLLDDNRIYQGMTKKEFIRNMDVVFQKAQLAGDNGLAVFPFRCTGCTCQRSGISIYLFSGRRSGIAMLLTFELDNNKHVTNLYECPNVSHKLLATASIY